MSIMKLVRGAFKTKSKRTLDELYVILKDRNDEFQIKESEIRHRVRSAIFSLKQSNEIRRVDSSTYEKL